ncbi:MAG: hypothetical protein AABX54_03665 [Nanoarchaeota archaeon]
MSHLENLKYTYNFFIKPIAAVALFPDASPTILRKIATDECYDALLTPLRAISMVSGALMGLKLLSYQLSVLNNLTKEYNQPYNYIPLALTAASLLGEGVRFGIGVFKEVRAEKRQQRLESRVKDTNLKQTP